MRKLILPLLVLAVLAYWFGLDQAARTLAHASARGLAVYALLTALVVLGYALRWRLVATALGAAPPLGRLTAARLAGDAVGSLVPSAKLAGEPVRVALVRGGGTSTVQATAGVAIDRLLELFGNLVAVLVYMAVFCAVRGATWTDRTPVGLAAATLLLLVALAALLVRLRGGGRPFAALYGARARALVPRLATWMDGVRHVEDHLARFFHEHPRAFLLGALSSLLIEALTIVQYHALLAAFGIALDLPTLVLVLLGGGLANAAPLPAGLGALEAVQVAVVGAVAGRPDLGFVVGVIVRLHQTLLLLLGLAVLSYRGISLARLRPAAQRAGV